MDMLSLEKLRAEAAALGCGEVQIFYYPVTDSTNTRAAEYAANHPGESAIFIADSQTAGRGRRGRSFFSRGGVGIYMSVLLYPDKKISDATYLTPHAAVALIRAIKKCTGEDVGIKWVNDIYKNDKKIAGILAECKTDSDGILSHFILGMGINVYKTDYPSEISAIASSIEEETGKQIMRERLAAVIIRELFDVMAEGDTEQIYAQYSAASCLNGRRVQVMAAEGEYTATVRKINRDFSLCVECDDGDIRRIFCGEVSTKILGDG